MKLQILNNQISHGDGLATARELQRTLKDPRDKFQTPQRKMKPRSAIRLFKLLASYHGSQFVNHLVLSNFWQYRSAIPNPIASKYRTEKWGKKYTNRGL